MENIAEILEGVKTMGIGGHIRPDGDCVGSCMALYLYVKTYYPEIQADVYLDNPKPVFGHIDCMDEIKTELDGDKEYDLFVTCDVSARDRLAIAGPYFDTAKRALPVRFSMGFLILRKWSVPLQCQSIREWFMTQGYFSTLQLHRRPCVLPGN